MMRTILHLAAVGTLVTGLSLAAPAESRAGGIKNFGIAVNTPNGAFSFYSGGPNYGYNRGYGPYSNAYYNGFAPYNAYYGPVVVPASPAFYPPPILVQPSRAYYGGHYSPYGCHR